MHERDVCIRMMPMIWKWDNMQWHGNRRKMSLQHGSKTTMAQQARLLILILEPKINICSTSYLTSINYDLKYTHRGSQKELMRVEFASKLFLWSYLCYLQFSAARIKLNLKRHSKHFHKFLRQKTW
jgi:hypothetical protein